jgi:trimeric autotransporter adhesin
MSRAALVVAAVGTALALLLGGGPLSRQPHRAPAGRSSVPRAAQGPISAALGADDPAYRVRLRRNGLYALSPSQRFRVAFTAGAVSVASPTGRLSMALTGVGDRRLEHPLRLVAPQEQRNRVAYRDGAVTEWYANGPLGLEQGFSISRLPNRPGHRPLTLALHIGGDFRPVLAGGGREVLFHAAGHGATLRYTGLFASDAGGRTLHAWLAVHGRSLLLSVDARRARYPLRIDPLIQAAELTASDGSDGDQLGDAVAFSGTTIAVGAPQHAVAGHQGQGAVYVFSAPSSGNWHDAYQTAELTASDGALGDGLGSSVAISGSTIVAGAPAHGAGGAAYVFSLPASGHWQSSTQTAELTASDGGAGDELGNSVGASAGTIAAGAPEHTVSANGGQGAVYLFSEPTTGAWKNARQVAELTASDGTAGDQLGYSVAISGTTIAAGAIGHTILGRTAQGAVYVFSKPGSSGWTNRTQTAELAASDGQSGDGLGDSVATSGSTIAAGSILHSVGANGEQGAVYVFSEPSPAGWKNGFQTAEMTAGDGAAGDQLGYSLSIAGGTIVAGAPEHTVAGAAARGSVYVFSQPSPGGWRNARQTTELTASDGGPGDELGSSVAISATAIAAGAPEHAIAARGKPGAAYVFGGPTPSQPILTNLKQSHRTWRPGKGLARITRAASAKAPLGTTFSFALNTSARVTFVFTQRITGRRAGRTCVAQNPANRRAPRCIRTVSRGVLAFTGHNGTNKVYFEGAISRSHRLRPGNYTMIALASATGLVSPPRTLRFAITRTS